MARFMKPYSAQTYAALRIVAGFLFLWHGSTKLFGFPSAAPEMPAAILYIAGPLEMVGGIFLVVGFQKGP